MRGLSRGPGLTCSEGVCGWVNSQGLSPAQPEVRGCSGHQLQPCPMYKARRPQSGQDRVTSRASGATRQRPVGPSAPLPGCCHSVSVLFSLPPASFSVSHSISVCLPLPLPVSVVLSLSLCVCVCVCFSKVFMICPFCPRRTLFRIKALAAPPSEHLQHLSQHPHQACPSSSCVPLPPSLLYWESLLMCPSPLQYGARVPPHHQPLGPLPAVQPGSPGGPTWVQPLCVPAPSLGLA